MLFRELLSERGPSWIADQQSLGAHTPLSRMRLKDHSVRESCHYGCRNYQATLGQAVGRPQWGWLEHTYLSAGVTSDLSTYPCCFSVSNVKIDLSKFIMQAGLKNELLY